MGLTRIQLLDALTQTGAVMSGHFVLTSGRHSDTYIQCARILEDPALTTELARTVAERVADLDVELVASPAVGGIIFGFAVAQALGVKFIFSERERGQMTFRRSFQVPAHARVLVAEDVVTTGGSVAEVIDLVRQAGGEAVGVVSIIDRGGEKAFDLELMSLVQLEVESWGADDCPLCAAGQSVASPGSRRLSG